MELGHAALRVSTPFSEASGTWTMSVRPEERRQVRETADVVEVVMGQEQVDLVGALEQSRRRRLQQPAQTRAGVEEEEQGAFVDGEAGRLALGRGDPAWVPRVVRRTAVSHCVVATGNAASAPVAARDVLWTVRSSAICYPVPAFVGERAFMQSELMAAAQAVTLDSPYDSVFGPLVDDLVDALSTDDPAVFLTAVEGRARLVATERSLRAADVFVALQLGLGAFRDSLAAVSPGEALAAQRLGLLEGEALVRAGVGYSEALEEVVERLGRTVVGLTATDTLTGLINADEVGRRLVELERCRRTGVGLGDPRRRRGRRRRAQR